jgi:Protein of unknown function (DUF642)
MNRHYRAAVLAIVLLAAGMAPGQAANLIKNPSFENPAVPAGSYAVICVVAQACPNEPAFPDWTVVGAINANIAVVNNYAQGGLTFPAQSGKQCVDLTGQSNAPAGIRQVVATKVGETYKLSFWVGAIYDPSGTFGPLSKVDVYVDGLFLTSAIKVANPGETALAWQQFSVAFQATSAQTTIAFFNGDPPGIGGANGLDSVSLVVMP